MNVGFEPIDWVYSQSSGHLYLCDAQDVRTLVATGYSGAVGHQYRPESDQLKSRGPIPRGVWRLGTKFNHARLGPASIPLTPVEESMSSDDPTSGYTATTPVGTVPQAKDASSLTGKPETSSTASHSGRGLEP